MSLMILSIMTVGAVVDGVGRSRKNIDDDIDGILGNKDVHWN